MKFKEFGVDVEISILKLKNADMIRIAMPNGPAILDRDQAYELIKEIQSKFEES